MRKEEEQKAKKENSPSKLAMEKRKLSILGAEQSGVAVRLRGTTVVVTGTLSKPCEKHNTKFVSTRIEH